MAEFLARVYIGKVDFDGGYLRAAYGIAYSYARMGIGGRVYQDGVNFIFGFPYQLHYLALVIGLHDINSDLILFGQFS